MKNALRKIGFTISGALLWISLLGLATSGVLAQTVRDKETVKGWLDKSGFYEELADAVLEQMKSEGTNGLATDIDVADPEINAVIDQAFSPKLLKEITDNVVDGTFNWLEEKTAEPEYQIALGDSKQKLAEGLGAYAAQRVSGLPACSPLQLQAYSSGYNPLTANCQPPGVSSEQISGQVEAEVLAGLDYLPDNLDSTNDLAGNNEAMLPESLKAAYRISGWAYSLFIAGVIVGSAGVLLLSSKRRNGFYRAGAIYLTSGLTTGLLAFMLGKGPGQISRLANTSGNGQASSDIALALASVAGQDISRLLWWYAGVFAAVGLVAILVAKFLLREGDKHPDNTPKDPVPPIDDSAHVEAKTDAEKPKTESNSPVQPKQPPKIQL